MVSAHAGFLLKRVSRPVGDPIFSHYFGPNRRVYELPAEKEEVYAMARAPSQGPQTRRYWISSEREIDSTRPCSGPLPPGIAKCCAAGQMWDRPST